MKRLTLTAQHVADLHPTHPSHVRVKRLLRNAALHMMLARLCRQAGDAMPLRRRDYHVQRHGYLTALAEQWLSRFLWSYVDVDAYVAALSRQLQKESDDAAAR